MENIYFEVYIFIYMYQVYIYVYFVYLYIFGRRDDTCDHGLSRRSLRVKTYELSWKVKVMIKYIAGIQQIIVTINNTRYEPGVPR